MAVTGGQMKAAQKKVDDVSKNLDRVRQEITKLRVAIKTSQRLVLLHVWQQWFLYSYMNEENKKCVQNCKGLQIG
jgi:hypothetical protein